MANSGGGSLERALEELIRRLLREEMAGLAGTAPGAAAAPAAPGRGLSVLNQAVSRILQPTGQTDIMAALLRSAAEVSGRCVLFVRRGDNFAFWRAEGFSAPTANSLRSVSLSATQAGPFREVCDGLQPLCCPRSSAALPAALEQALGGPAEKNLCLLPVVVQGKVVAALYADSGASPGSEEMSGLEILAKVTGLSLETAGGRAAAGTAEVARPAAAAEAMAPVVTEAPGEPVRLETPAAEAVAEAAPSGGSFGASFPAAAEAAAVLPPPPDPDSLPTEERDSHKKAHRFARVAVQDLMTYHKDKIADGRKNKNLFLVLKEDIEKTRENYQKRFGQTPARSFDYLHYEMVAKLAGHDPAVLGEEYPGPRAAEE